MPWALWPGAVRAAEGGIEVEAEPLGMRRDAMNGRPLPTGSVVKWKSRDGLDLSGYLIRPPGAVASIAFNTTGDNQSFYCHHYVPGGVTCYITAMLAANPGRPKEPRMARLPYLDAELLFPQEHQRGRVAVAQPLGDGLIQPFLGDVLQVQPGHLLA